MECGEILQPISVIECLAIAIVGVKLSIAPVRNNEIFHKILDRPMSSDIGPFLIIIE